MPVTRRGIRGAARPRRRGAGRAGHPFASATASSGGEPSRPASAITTPRTVTRVPTPRRAPPAMSRIAGVGVAVGVTVGEGVTPGDPLGVGASVGRGRGGRSRASGPESGQATATRDLDLQLAGQRGMEAVAGGPVARAVPLPGAVRGRPPCRRPPGSPLRGPRRRRPGARDPCRHRRSAPSPSDSVLGASVTMPRARAAGPPRAPRQFPCRCAGRWGARLGRGAITSARTARRVRCAYRSPTVARDPDAAAGRHGDRERRVQVDGNPAGGIL